MMKIGIETESCHLLFQNKKMDIFAFIEKAAEYGYDGVMINIIEKKNLTDGLGALGKDDIAHLLRVRDALRQHNLFVEVDARGTEYTHLAHVLKVADTIGADLVRTFVMTSTNYSHSNLCGTFDRKGFKNVVNDLQKIIPLLKKYRIRLAIENHELETIDEINWLVSQVNSPWVGITLDIGNTINAWEDPLSACEKAAAKTFTVHLKDSIVCKCEDKYYVSGAPLGQGSIDIKNACKILYEKSTLTRFVVEICHPYASTFKRPIGTGGIKELGQGAFEVKEPFFPPEEVRPIDYYTYDGKLLDEIMSIQMQLFKEAVQFFHTICEEIENEN